MPGAFHLQNVIRYYDALLDTYPDDSRAVGWRNAASQNAKFSELIEVFAHERRPFTVYDVGCGLGSLHAFLEKHNPLASYSGGDINPRMISRARAANPRLRVERRDLLASPLKKTYDYVVASGTFNLRLDVSNRAWQVFIYRMAQAMYASSRRGIAIGFLSSLAQHQAPGEHYQKPWAILQFVQRQLTPLAEVRHSHSPGHFAVFAYHSLPRSSTSRLRGPSLKSKSTIESRGTNAP